jgi:hypothetical protein
VKAPKSLVQGLRTTMDFEHGSRRCMPILTMAQN